jgi:hypothetical protein
MSDPVQLAPSAEALKSLFIEQYKNSVNLRKIVEISAAGKDDLEAKAFAIRGAFTMATAVGEQLDYVGELFNCHRKLRNDEDYRTEIMATALQTSTATPQDLITLLKRAFGATSVEYLQEVEATFFVILIGETSALSQNYLDSVSPAGVQGISGDYLCTYDGTPITTYSGGKIAVRKVAP